MSVIVLLFYCLAFIFLLHRMIRNKEVPLTVREISLAFLLKAGLACLYGYIYLHYYDGDDTWAMHYQSLEEQDKFLNDPGEFFYNFSFDEAYQWEGRRFWPALSTWFYNMEKYSIPKALALFDIFSGDNYYINTVFFNFILFWGHYWLFSVLVKAFPAKRTPLMLIIFFFPPLVFWLSGIRADGLLLFFFGLLLVHFSRWLKERTKKQLLFCLLALAGIFIYRNALLLLLIPGMIAWYMAVTYSRKPLPVFATVYGITILLFFASAWISPHVNAPNIIVQKQQQYMALNGTRFQLDSLQPNVAGFARVLPQAVGNTFFRPYVWEAAGMLQIVTALEVIVFWLLMLAPIVKRDERWKEISATPLVLFCLFFGISLYIFIGYTVPFPGAIVRYKALGELILLTIPAIYIKWPSRQ